MIQDIQPRKLDNQYNKDKTPAESSTVMCFYSRMILLKNPEEIQYLTYGQYCQIYKAHGEEAPQVRYLFSVDTQDYYLGKLPEEYVPEGFAYYNMFETRAMKPMWQVMAASTAFHLFSWYDTNVFCGRCGEKLEHHDAQRMLSCPHCGNMVFPKIAPAVIVGVTHKGRILLTRYRDREYTRHALIAGFTEIGESVEETVAREVMEEVGLPVTNIRYYKSQPWGYDSNVLMGYFCDLEADQEINLDQEELSAAKWFLAKDVPADTEGLSLTREMMDYFREQNGQV